MNEASVFRQVTEEAKKRREALNESAKARKASEIAAERAQNAQRAKPVRTSDNAVFFRSAISDYEQGTLEEDENDIEPEELAPPDLNS